MTVLKPDQQMKTFARLTDPERMKGFFQEQLPPFSDGYMTITSCKIGYTQYKTYKKISSYGRSFLSIVYHLEVSDPMTRNSGGQMLYAKAYLENRSQTEFEKAGNDPFVTPRFGKPFSHLPELDMIVWAFPNDPVLVHLPQCIDPEKVSGYFPYEKLPAGLDRPEDIQRVDTEVIHYRPEVRCTTRYALKWGKASETKEMVLFGKTFKDDQGRGLYKRSRALFHEGQRDSDSFLIAQPLGYNEQIKTLWQAGLKGKVLVDLMDETNYQPLIQSVAKGLASFHQSALTSPVRVVIGDQIVEIQKKIAKLIRAFPQFRVPLKSIEQCLEKDGNQLSPFPETIIHADFSIQQLLVCGDKIACFDFDEFVIGDPIQDVANFIVDCHFRSFDRDLVPLMISTFVYAYEQRGGFEISTNRLNWYVQMLFVTKAYRFYLQQRPQLEEEIKAILALAQKEIPLERRMK